DSALRAAGRLRVSRATPSRSWRRRTGSLAIAAVALARLINASCYRRPSPTLGPRPGVGNGYLARDESSGKGIMPRITAEQFTTIVNRSMPLVERMSVAVEALGRGSATLRLTYSGDYLRPGGTVAGPA